MYCQQCQNSHLSHITEPSRLLVSDMLLCGLLNFSPNASILCQPVNSSHSHRTDHIKTQYPNTYTDQVYAAPAHHSQQSLQTRPATSSEDFDNLEWDSDQSLALFESANEPPWKPPVPQSGCSFINHESAVPMSEEYHTPRHDSVSFPQWGSPMLLDPSLTSDAATTMYDLSYVHRAQKRRTWPDTSTISSPQSIIVSPHSFAYPGIHQGRGDFDLSSYGIGSNMEFDSMIEETSPPEAIFPTLPHHKVPMDYLKLPGDAETPILESLVDELLSDRSSEASTSGKVPHDDPQCGRMCSTPPD